jgi:hypothetical protein
MQRDCFVMGREIVRITRARELPPSAQHAPRWRFEPSIKKTAVVDGVAAIVTSAETRRMRMDVIFRLRMRGDYCGASIARALTMISRSLL